VRNIKRGLYRFAAGIGKAPVKRDMKNIFEGEVKGLDDRKTGKAIEWLAAMVSLLSRCIRTLFTADSSRMPRDRQTMMCKSLLNRTSGGLSIAQSLPVMNHNALFIARKTKPDSSRPVLDLGRIPINTASPIECCGRLDIDLMLIGPRSNWSPEYRGLPLAPGPPQSVHEVPPWRS
jgi:hypothetical protein